MKRTLLAVLAIIVALGLTLVAHPRFTKAEDDAPQLHDLRLVGTNDLQARSSYQPTVHRYSNNRWVIFVGHHALGTHPVTGDPLPSVNPLPVRTVAGGNPVISGLTGTHKSWWECDSGTAWVVGRRATDTAAGWRPGNHIMVFDISNPANPVFLRDWALDGQQPGGVPPPNFTAVPSIHGP